eukprot:SM000004S15086  [mRNA]  locus=s4:1270851:1273016:+ [translate_table: standard]
MSEAGGPARVKEELLDDDEAAAGAAEDADNASGGDGGGGGGNEEDDDDAAESFQFQAASRSNGGGGGDVVKDEAEEGLGEVSGRLDAAVEAEDDGDAEQPTTVGGADIDGGGALQEDDAEGEEEEEDGDEGDEEEQQDDDDDDDDGADGDDGLDLYEDVHLGFPRVPPPSTEAVKLAAASPAGAPPVAGAAAADTTSASPAIGEGGGAAPQSLQEQRAGQAAGARGAGASGGSTVLFVGELNWWTTDTELESALSEYGRIKNLKFFEEKASGKCKGFCQVDFEDAAAARACKEGMHGRSFQGRPCIVAFATPQSIKQMAALAAGGGQQQGLQRGNGQGARGRADQGGRAGYAKQGAASRSSQQSSGRLGAGGAAAAGRGGRPPGGGGVGGGGRGPLLAGPFGLGNPMGPAGMMAGGNFDPAATGFGPMPGRGFGMVIGMGMYNPMRAPLYGGMAGMAGPPAFPPGLPGVAPHINPAFFGRAGGVGFGGVGGAANGGSMEAWEREEMMERMRRTDDPGSEYGEGRVTPERGWGGEWAEEANGDGSSMWDMQPRGGGPMGRRHDGAGEPVKRRRKESAQLQF